MSGPPYVPRCLRSITGEWACSGRPVTWLQAALDLFPLAANASPGLSLAPPSRPKACSCTSPCLTTAAEPGTSTATTPPAPRHEQQGSCSFWAAAADRLRSQMLSSSTSSSCRHGAGPRGSELQQRPLPHLLSPPTHNPRTMHPTPWLAPTPHRQLSHTAYAAPEPLRSSSSSTADQTQPTPAPAPHQHSTQPTQPQPHPPQQHLTPASPPPPAPISLPSSHSSAPAIIGVSTLQSGTGFKKTFYKRHLPSPPAIAFASPEGRQLLAEALAAGTMAGFFRLVEQFSTQDEPAFCGLTSLSMVLNALSIDPRRTWKGAWRWFHEGMLDCCRPLDAVRREGITLVQAAVLARCNGARVDIRRHGSFTEEEFRKQVEQVCTSGEEHLILSYSRKPFGQTGDGHFSPVGGYHRERDLVLILDVARFKYPPHWVPLHMLYDSMSYLDPMGGLPRGYLLMSAHHMLDSAMFTLDVRQEGWQQASSYAAALPTMLREYLAKAALAGGLGEGGAGGGAGAGVAAAPRPAPTSLPLPPPTAALPPPPSPAVVGAVQHLLLQLPLDSAMSFVVVRQQAVGPADRCVPHGARDALLAELRVLALYQIVAEGLRQRDGAREISERMDSRLPDPCGGSAGNGESFLAERVTLLLLLLPASAWPGPSSWGSEELAAQWQSLTDLAGYSIVATEVAYLRQQFMNVEQVLQGGPLEAACGEPSCSHTHKLDCAAHGQQQQQQPQLQRSGSA